MGITRRTFLRYATAGSAAAAAVAPWPAGGGDGKWEQLRRRLAGPLFRPADPGYTDARHGFFSLYDARRPAAVAHCTRVEDVQACVDFAARNGIRIAARGGGHSYAGYSTVDGGLIAALSPLDSVEVRADGTVVVGAGARLGQVYAACAAAGRALPGGTCPTVGIAGLTLGGGIGVLGRKYGLTCDHLESARIVTADGHVRTVSAESSPDLLWALRGGGGGNFGIVTSLTFRTVPAKDLTVYSLSFPPAALATLLAVWPEWLGGLPDELWTNCGAGPGIANNGGCFVGPESGLKPLVDDLVRRVGTAPLTRTARELSHVDAMKYFADCDDLGGPACAPGWTGGGGGVGRGAYVGTSRMLTKPFADPQATAELLSSEAHLFTLIDGAGGALGRVPQHGSAFAHRGALGSFQVLHDVNASVGDEAHARKVIGGVRDELGKEFGAAGYVNYVDPHMPEWAKAYYGASLPRLRAIARKCDPDRVFAFPQGLSAT